MMEYICVEVSNYSQIAEKTKEYLDKGWHLHTYQATGHADSDSSSHFLLFEKDSVSSNQ